MGERRDYSAPRELRHLYGTLGRTATRRNELVVGMRNTGNAYRPVWEGPTSALPPFAPDEPMDDDDE